MKLLLFTFLVVIINGLYLDMPSSCDELVAICETDSAAASATHIGNACYGQANETACAADFAGFTLCSLVDSAATVYTTDATHATDTLPAWIYDITPLVVDSTTYKVVIDSQEQLNYYTVWAWLGNYGVTSMPWWNTAFGNVLQCYAESKGLNYYRAANSWMAAGQCFADTECYTDYVDITNCAIDEGLPYWEPFGAAANFQIAMPENIDQSCDFVFCGMEHPNFQALGAAGLLMNNFYDDGFAEGSYDMQTCIDTMEDEIKAFVGKLVMIVCIIGIFSGCGLMGCIWGTCHCCKKGKKGQNGAEP